MYKNQSSRGTHASVPSTVNRKLFWARFSLVLLALVITSLQTRTSARTTDQPHLGAQASVTRSQSPPSAQVDVQVLLKGNTSATHRMAKVSARNCPACQQALVECLGGGGGGDCFVQYYACIASCQ